MTLIDFGKLLVKHGLVNKWSWEDSFGVRQSIGRVFRELPGVVTPGGDPIFTTYQVTNAVNDSCSCGGKGPNDGCCQACEVWHRLHGRKVKQP